MNKRILSSVFLLIALFVLSLPHITITGDAISEIPQGQNIIYIISLAFFLVSVFFFIARKSLDAIIIPTGKEREDEQRTSRGLKEYKERGSKYFVISGNIDEKNNLRESQTYGIYKQLREHDIKPSQMIIEGKARDSIQNILYSLKKIKDKGGREVGIVSYPLHLERFNEIVKRGKKEGLIDEDFNIHRIETDQSIKQGIYGILAEILQEYRLRHGIKKSLDLSSNEKKFTNFIKNILSGK